MCPPISFPIAARHFALLWACASDCGHALVPLPASATLHRSRFRRQDHHLGNGHVRGVAFLSVRLFMRVFRCSQFCLRAKSLRLPIRHRPRRRRFVVRLVVVDCRQCRRSGHGIRVVYRRCGLHNDRLDANERHNRRTTSNTMSARKALRSVFPLRGEV